MRQAWTSPTPPFAILDFYGAKHFKHEFWSNEIEQIKSRLPPHPPDSAFEHLFVEKTTFIGSQSLEGQQQDGPNLKDPRQAFALYSIANGRCLQAIWPSTPDRLEEIDPVLRVNPQWPPTCFVHGTADFMIPLHLSRHLESQLRAANIETEFIEVPGEPHTFVGKMVKGSKTWETQRRGFDFLEKVLERHLN